MKMNTLIKALPLAFAIAFVAGCSTTDTDDSSSVSDNSGTDTMAATTTTAMETDDGITTDTMDDGADDMPAPEPVEPSPPPMASVVYFSFDKATLLPEARALLNAYAEELKRSGRNIRLEGHADERGTREYNLALGERRALAVQSYLAIQGVSRGQMEPVSYGEEKPAEYGTSEDAWSKNRRVELRR